MILSFGTLTLILLGTAIVWFWHDSLRARDIANAAAMAACERMGLQFLDGTAAFARLRLARSGGWLALRRTYVFDYTAQSIERRQGFAILLGMAVEYVGFAPEHTARPLSPTPEPERSTAVIDAPASGKVLDFNEHRSRRAETSESVDTTPRDRQS